MVDEELVARINELAEQEHRLERAAGSAPLSADDKARLESIAMSLDTCYDLLRQRRARRSAGLDPDQARPRGAEIVEGYEQ